MSLESASNQSSKWLDHELELLLTWWESNYESTISAKTQPAIWTAQVREAGLSTKTTRQIKTKWITWIRSYKITRKKALKNGWESSSDTTPEVNAALERKCPRYWRLHSLINNTVVIQPSDSHDSKKQESRETLIVKNIPTDTLDKEIFVNSDENSLHSITQSPAYVVPETLCFSSPSASLASVSQSIKDWTPPSLLNEGSQAELKRVKSNFEDNNSEDDKHIPRKMTAKPTSIWVTLIYQAEQRYHIEMAKLRYAKSSDEHKARHEITMKKLEMEEAQRQRAHELVVMNKKIELENIKLELYQKRGNVIQ
ncbi:hypothetical protein HI914_04506 [Erysiphe necator]|nr:hypothetical protein HI914_04506 [Erysiphe necator]